MPESLLAELRRTYHRALCKNILGVATSKPKPGSVKEPKQYYNNADGSNPASVALAAGIAAAIGGPFCPPEKLPSAQSSGSRFALLTMNFLEESFKLLHHLRPGAWTFSASQGSAGITAYDQYKHLADLAVLAEKHPEIRMALGGDYLIVPDIIVGKEPFTDERIDSEAPVIANDEKVARLTPIRASNQPTPQRTLHASISCKWTIRSDRAQNTRTEALNLLRNRKGKSPQMIIVTAEPLPSRLMSIAVGTGDIDCTYHAALDELLAAAKADPTAFSEHLYELETLITGRRLRDISDLPFDLAV